MGYIPVTKKVNLSIDYILVTKKVNFIIHDDVNLQDNNPKTHNEIDNKSRKQKIKFVMDKS